MRPTIDAFGVFRLPSASNKHLTPEVVNPVGRQVSTPTGNDELKPGKGILMSSQRNLSPRHKSGGSEITGPLTSTLEPEPLFGLIVVNHDADGPQLAALAPAGRVLAIMMFLLGNMAGFADTCSAALSGIFHPLIVDV